MNQVILSGNLCSDPEFRLSADGMEIVKFTVAVYAGMDKESDFIRCVGFKNTANIVNENGSKGSKVLISGSWKTGSYEKDGVKKYTNECIVNRAEFMKKKDVATASNVAEAFEGEEVDPEVPF